MNPTIETITGKVVDLVTPHVDQICLEDIFYGLSRIARFNGHTIGEFPYSVAQHSIWCAKLAMKYFGATHTTALKVLLHDAHEAYTGDIVTPLKMTNSVNVKPLQNRLQKLILNHLDIMPPTSEEKDLIKVVDNYALAIEAFTLTKSKGSDWGLPVPPLKHYSVWQQPKTPDEACTEIWNTYILLINKTPMKQLCA